MYNQASLSLSYHLAALPRSPLLGSTIGHCLRLNPTFKATLGLGLPFTASTHPSVPLLNALHSGLAGSCCVGL